MDIKALKYAFINTLPVLVGYLFVGIAFGILLAESGLGIGWSVGMAFTIYGGSLQFALIPLLSAGTDILTIALLSLSISSRQLFYGLSLIERFRKNGIKSLFMIHCLSDESYSVFSGNTPQDTDSTKYDFYVCVLNISYWVAGCAIGSLFGAVITFNTAGIDFAMTALFVVICTEQWLGSKNHIPAIIGALCACICLAILGPDRFILPAMAISVGILMLMQNFVRKGDSNE